jgi:hypothetical protein
MEDRVYYTYAYLREDGTPYYVGRGKGRRSTRPHRIKVPKKDRILILKEGLTFSESTKHEVYMIAVLGRKDLGTGILRNLTDGGEGALGRVFSLETKKMISASRKGRPTRFGPHTEESKKKMSESLRGRRLTEEHRERIRAQQKGKIVSEETKAKLKEARSKQVPPTLGQTRTPEQKERMSLANKEAWKRRRAKQCN